MSNQSTLKSLVNEAVNSETRIAGERDHIKHIKDRMVEEHGVASKKMAGKIIKAFYNNKAEEESEESKEFQELIEQIRNGSV